MGAISQPYLKLSQFLDLESRWLGAPNKDELCHRICRTVVLLLGTPAAAIGLASGRSAYRVVAAEGDWPEPPQSGPLARRARETATPQIRNTGDHVVGLFPFSAGAELSGCLHVRQDRPVFQADEVAFLRFLASLTGIVVAGGTPDVADPLETSDGDSESADVAARKRVAMAVHDLRNPLAVLAGYVDLIATKSLGELNEQQTKAAEAMRGQIDVISDAIGRLMDLDRHETAESVAVSRVDLRSVFDEIANSRFPHATDRITWPGPEAAFGFETDRHRLVSIIQNLVDNALRHAGDGRVMVDCSQRRKHLVLRVTDEGPGLSPERTATLEASVAGEERTSTHAERGLGLKAVGTHVRALGGKLEVSRGARGGAVISVQIPARREAQDASARAD